MEKRSRAACRRSPIEVEGYPQPVNSELNRRGLSSTKMRLTLVYVPDSGLSGRSELKKSSSPLRVSPSQYRALD